MVAETKVDDEGCHIQLKDLSRRWCDLMTPPKKKTSGR